MAIYYAHSTEKDNKSDWQELSEHLVKVAELAGELASVFNAGEWGRLAGLFHDAGKATQAFTDRLEGKAAKVDHSTFGARLARDRSGKLGLLLAYIVAGHHGGLPDGGDQEAELHYRLKHGKVPKDVEILPEVAISVDLFLPFKGDREYAGFCLSFFTRMIFSCLVDADFLDTETFCSPQKSRYRPTPTKIETFFELKKRLDRHLEEKCQGAESTPVNALRQSVLAQCREKAKLQPQIFSLTVPTGGGKTLSSLAFALNHVVEQGGRHGLRRIIYAIPFTSIIEQNAMVFQDVLGKDQVLEHHCNYKESDKPEESDYDQRRGLATENWEAPVVVTTNVQFFESLFSNRPSRCRKLHNIAHSVIVLDEAQAIPTEYLEPCLAALRELVEHYGCTVVLCTATQPAFDDQNTLKMAIPKIQEIIDDRGKLFRELRRTEVEFLGQISDEELCERLRAERQVLCIVSTKPHARKIFEQVQDEEGVFHLSTNMYPLHRRRVLDQVRKHLNAGEPCRVISTSLVEAGVDLDFPVVYRAMAGLDSIAQAAGRCNREGKLIGSGKVFVFEEEKPPRMPWIKRCIARAGETLRTLPGADPLGLEAMRRYFELLYDVQDLDRKQILALLNPKLDRELHIPFREAAQAFRFIEDDTVGVIVAIEPEARKLVQELRYTEHPRSTLRKLQQYSIGLRSAEFAAMRGGLELIHGAYPVLCNEAAYREDVGLCVDSGNIWDDGRLIV